MGDLIDFEDHKKIEFEAIRSGLSYSNYRRKLRLYNIPVDTAIKNISKGISIEEYLHQRAIEEARDIRRTKIGFASVITATVASLLYSIVNPTPSRYETTRQEHNVAVAEHNLPLVKELSGRLKEVEWSTFGTEFSPNLGYDKYHFP